MDLKMLFVECVPFCSSLSVLSMDYTERFSMMHTIATVSLFPYNQDSSAW